MKNIDYLKSSAEGDYFFPQSSIKRFDGSVRIPKPSGLLNPIVPKIVTRPLFLLKNDMEGYQNSGRRKSKIGSMNGTGQVTPRHEGGKENDESKINSAVQSDFYFTQGGLILNKDRLVRNGALPVEEICNKSLSDAKAVDMKKEPSGIQRKRGIDEINQSDIDMLLRKKSSHADEESDEWFKSYSLKMEKLARAEYAAKKTNEVHQLKIKGFYCETCNLVTEVANDLCRRRQHLIKIVSVLKRFFECKRCRKREYTLGNEKVPRNRCGVCGFYEWLACGKNGTGDVFQDATERLVTCEWDRRKLEPKRGELDGLASCSLE